MAPSNREIFAANLVKIMRIKGLAQVDIVQALKVSPTTVSEWTRALKYPRIDTMQRLADYLEVPMQMLTLEHKQDGPLDAEFAKLFAKLSLDKKEFIIQAMKGLLEGK